MPQIQFGPESEFMCKMVVQWTQWGRISFVKTAVLLCFRRADHSWRIQLGALIRNADMPSCLHDFFRSTWKVKHIFNRSHPLQISVLFILNQWYPLHYITLQQLWFCSIERCSMGNKYTKRFCAQKYFWFNRQQCVSDLMRIAWK